MWDLLSSNLIFWWFIYPVYMWHVDLTSSMYSRNTSMVDYKDKCTNSLLLMPGNTGSSVEYYCC